MIPEVGHFILILAMLSAVLVATVPVLGLRFNVLQWQKLAFPLTLLQLVLLTLSFLALSWSFYVDDFSVLYIASNSNSKLPLFYKLSAVWGAHEGSLLLWLLLLSGWVFALAWHGRKLEPSLQIKLLAVLGIITSGFMAFIIATSNPFTRVLPLSPIEGADLNPMLQDPALVIHPPMLYLGYVGFAVPFALAVVALLQPAAKAQMLVAIRRFALLAWAFLTAGIVLGSWWAYYELGWGGWWFWDPVENASFMPWLTATALVHAVNLTIKREVGYNWTILLAITCFALCLLGTFLVRSGVLISVHAFASDPARGKFILAYLVSIIGGALALFTWRMLQEKNFNITGFKIFSRETWLLVNNLLFVVAAATILLGTLYPLIVDALGFGKLSVGPPYFNQMFVPLMLLMLAFLGGASGVKWQQQSVKEFAKKYSKLLLLSLVLAIGLLALFANEFKIMVMLAIFLALWVVLTTVRDAYNLVRNIKKLNGSQAGMLLAHVGVAVVAIGVAITSSYSIEKDMKIKVGETVNVAGYDFTFSNLQQRGGPNFRSIVAKFDVFKKQQPVAQLFPEKRLYLAREMALSETAILPGAFRDLYLAIGQELGDNAWSVRVYYKPFVRWIWIGGVLIALGCVCAATHKSNLRKTI